MNLLRRLVDERFLRHRQRSTSVAGIVGAGTAILLFLYRLYVDGIWNWDLLAVGLVVAGVKVLLMVWFFLTE
jgi:hypothetical protein